MARDRLQLPLAPSNSLLHTVTHRVTMIFGSSNWWRGAAAALETS
jgi:hypothetical protein